MIKQLMISCREATLLTEKKMGGRLSFTDRLRLVIHQALCDGCRRYQQQSRLIDHIFRAQSTTAETREATGLEDRVLKSLEGHDRIKGSE